MGMHPMRLLENNSPIDIILTPDPLCALGLVSPFRRGRLSNVSNGTSRVVGLHPIPNRLQVLLDLLLQTVGLLKAL